MTMKIKKVLSVLLIIVLMVALNGCTTYNNFKNAYLSKDNVAKERTVKIGIFEPITGKFKKLGEEEIKGIELAYSLKPEVCGKKVELIYADNKSSIYEAENVVKELFNTNSPSVVLGSYGETLTLVASKLVKATNTPAITISSTNPLITANNEYYFSASYSETKQGDALADFLYNEAKRDVVATVSLGDDDTTTATIKRFTNKIKSLTGNSKSVAGSFALPIDTVDYSDTIEKLRQSGAKAAFLALTPEVAQEFITQCVNAKLTHVLFVGTREWNNEDFIGYLKGQNKIKAAFVSEVNVANESEMVKKFNEAYAQKYGSLNKPTQATALAFDAYMIALKAIEEANEAVKNTDPEDLVKNAKTEAEGMVAKKLWEQAMDTGIPAGVHIKDALKNINNYLGASGIINFDGSNEVTKEVSIIRIRQGKEVIPYNVDKSIGNDQESDSSENQD